MRIVRLGRCAQTISGVGFPDSAQGSPDGDLPFLKVSDLANQANSGGVVTAANWVTTSQARTLGVRSVPPDSIVFPKVGAAMRGNARALTRVECAIDNNMMAVVPNDGEPRYWCYMLSTVDMALLDMGGTLPFVSDSAVRDLHVALPTVDEQRRIADFLDGQVARIDDAIGRRSRQRLLVARELDAKWGVLASEVAERGDRVPMRRVLRSICDGPFGSSLTSGHYVDDGVRVIRLGNVGLNAFRDSDRAFISKEYALELAAHSVATGDIVMAGLGDETWPLGRCAVVPPGVAPGVVKADCYRIRLVDAVAHDYAACYLSSPLARAEFSNLARGSTRARLNTAIAVDVTIPIVAEATQRRVVEDFNRARESASRVEAALTRSIDLLNEYKLSLITAAVTGELDVMTARTGVPA